MKKIAIIFMLFALIFVFIYQPILEAVADEIVPREKLEQHNFEAILPVSEDSTYINYTDFRLSIAHATATPQQILNAMDSKVVRIDTAEELYRFSVDVSYHPNFIYQTSIPSQNVKLSLAVRQVLLGLDYALGNDIDYSVMKSRQFIPIGFQFTTVEAEYNEQIFTGTFNGQGYEISNLYVAGYDLITIVEGEGESAIDTALSQYYAMFTYNQGIITNLGLVNPTYELQSEHSDITKAANLVGVNQNIVENVYVIDNRENVLNAGIRMRAPIGASTTNYSAAGIVYENQHIFKNAYYVSRVVVNASFINNFTVHPVLYTNTGAGIYESLVYDQTLYQLTVTVGGSSVTINTPNGYALGETTQTLRTNSSLGASQWFYYPQDRYPALWGLDYVGGKYQIDDARDFITFSKLLYLNTVVNNQVYRDADYVLTDDIDMSTFARYAYQTPTVEFTGSLSGLKGTNENYYISNLHLRNGVLLDSTYYSGLFSILKGEVTHITFANSTLVIEDSENFYGLPFNIGLVAGRLDGGNIEHVSVQVDIDLGSTAIGGFNVGSIAGTASGVVIGVYSEGTINAGNHTFQTGQQITPEFNIGGIVGRTGQTRLTLYNALNQSQIQGVGSTNTVSVTQPTIIRMGGVIGYAFGDGVQHDFGLLTNEATVTARRFQSSGTINQFVAGVVGYSAGQSYIMSTYAGLWTNTGLLNFNAVSTNNVTSSGLVVTNHSEQTEFIYLLNDSEFAVSSYNNFKYAALVYDLSSTGIILSQSKNVTSFHITSSINVNASPVFYSEQNAPSLLRYVENSGDIIYANHTFSSERYIAGITLSTNVSYLNVIFSGNIYVYNINISNPVWVAGITHTLSAGHYLKNSLNDGDMIIAGINMTGTQNIHQNLYIAGLVNINLSGDLQNQDNAAQPQATLGIINSINNADISSTYDTMNYGITGFGNTYVGGIVTFNGGAEGGSIQDSLNMGNLHFVNLSPTNTAQVTFESSTNLGGRVIRYRYGIVSGGIAAAVTNGRSRILDTANSGEVIAISANFTRAGGVLGSALREELTAGNIPTEYYVGSVANTNVQHIEMSFVGNGINYGIVSAISQRIIAYSTSNANATTSSFYYYSITSNNYSSTTQQSRASTAERIGITASAGGVIGYGLSKMSRMVNHGEVSSTDVAGGIVGATFVYTTATNVTVYIDTMINYGSVRAVNNGQYNSIDKNSFNYATIENAFYATDSTFIYPEMRNQSDMRFAPEAKRGIGGVFGRLQRGQSRRMTTAGGIFDFIVNMDPNVDLIGRLDQVANFTSSISWFVFINAKYYSAKENDTTQAVFGGFQYINGRNGSSSTAPRRWTYTRVYEIYERYYYYQQGGQWYRRLQRQRENVTEYAVEGRLYQRVTDSGSLVSNNEIVIHHRNVTGTSWVNSGSAVAVPNASYPTYTDPVRIEPILISSSQTSGNLTAGSTYNYIVGTIPIPLVVEDPDYAWLGSFVYDPGFEMRNDNTLLTNGQPITSYIYYVENEVLSDRFRDDREYGMYVLASSSGSSFGAALPGNVVIQNMYRLNTYIPYDSDYETIDDEDKENLSQTLINEYLSLYQTRYNDKSALLEDNQRVESREIGGSESHLYNASINHSAKTITFELSLNQIQLGQTYVSYELTHVLLPANAVIAARYSDSGFTNLELFRNSLKSEIGQNISTNAPPTLNLTLTPALLNITSNTTVSLGWFVSYSEAALNEELLFTHANYYTEYQVFVTLKPRTSENSPRPQQYARDGGSLTNVPTAVNNIHTIPAGNTVSSTLRVTFRDPSNVMSLTYDIAEYVELYYGDELVDPAYYTLTSVGMVQTNRQFEITMTLSNQLRAGQYNIRFKYFAVDTEKRIVFTKANSSVRLFEDLTHYSSGAFTSFSGTTYATNLNFGYDLGLHEIDFGYTVDPNVPSYLDNRSYYVSFLDSIELSSFAILENVWLQSTTYNNGYITYQVHYLVRSENNATTTYIHNIVERPISIESVYKNNNRVNINDVFATREDSQTNFAIDYGVDPLIAASIYNLIGDNSESHFQISVTGQDFDGFYYTAAQITGITYSVDNFLNIQMSDETLPGNYTFVIQYNRGGTLISLTPNLVIRKNEGTSAYLTDVKFSESALETDYASIYVSNANGIVVPSSFVPRIYYAGIDYDDSDLVGTSNYRVDGEVANTPLNEFTPYFLEFLPAGSTISRKVYAIENPTMGWSPEANNNSSANIKGMLAADFTILPDTGQEPTEEQDVIITYRVTSEDGSHQVYYHITVVDVVFNVSVIFNIFYEDENGVYAAENSELLGVPILITVTNFNTENVVTSAQFATVAEFPNFTSVVSRNNAIHMFYTATTTNYRYRYGRNMSGYFGFKFEMPTDPNGNNYDYRIEFNNDELNDLSDYVGGMQGKYFYIGGGTKNRTRVFNVYIFRTNTYTDNSWGLTDHEETWKD